jgi:hypothetical protein
VTGGEMVVVDANGQLGSAPVGAPGANTVGSAEVIDNSLSADDLAPNAVATSELAGDSVDASKVAFNYAGSASEGGAATNADLLDGIDSAAFALAGSTASLGANTFTGTQTIDGGNIDLDASVGAAGNLTKNGSLFLHNFGTHNTFVGLNAGNLTMTGVTNTAIGS